MTTQEYTPLKRCPQCKQHLLATTENFSRDKSHKNGLASTCKVCNKARGAAWRKNNLDRERENNRKWRLEHPEQSRATRHAYYEEHIEQHRALGKKWNRRNRKRVNALSREWAKAHPEQIRKNAHCRRARIRNATGSHTAMDIIVLNINQRNKCAYCGCSLGDDYHVDHVIPLSRGGSDDFDNLALACPHCNASKNDRLLSEWIADVH